MHVDNQSNLLNRTYTYSATQNDGRIETMVDAVSGETVQYQYDSLKRLISAETTGTQWGQSFTYDGFGNLLAQAVTKGSAPSLSVLVSGTTNRITSSGYSYDANGNLTAAPGLTMAYDVENRMSSATSSSGTEWYAYDPMNRRTEKGTSGSQYGDKYLYDVDGSLLGTYRKTTGPFRGDSWAVNVYFAGRQVWQAWTGGDPYARGTSPDRLGSNVKHFPYGDEPTTTAPNRGKFATYYRDETTALDYARNRYYSSTIARFTTADPYLASGGAANPQSWNRYTYVQGDPVNLNDPEGLCPPGFREVDSATQIEGIIDVARSYLNRGLLHADGAHFLYNSDGSLRAIDCSGLVAQALAWISYDQFAPASVADVLSTTTVPQYFAADSSWHVGDIILFPGHAGIVTGVDASGQVTSFIGAQSSGVAEVENVQANPYWGPRLAQATPYKPCIPIPPRELLYSGRAPRPEPGQTTGTPTYPWYIHASVRFAAWVVSMKIESVTSVIRYRLPD